MIGMFMDDGHVGVPVWVCSVCDRAYCKQRHCSFCSNVEAPFPDHLARMHKPRLGNGNGYAFFIMQEAASLHQFTTTELKKRVNIECSSIARCFKDMMKNPYRIEPDGSEYFIEKVKAGVWRVYRRKKSKHVDSGPMR